MEKKLGVGIVVTPEQQLLGIITDGDVRRACAQGPEVFSRRAAELMTKKPKIINDKMRASLALNTMEQYNITSLVVVDSTTTVIGLLHVHQLLKAGIRKDIL
jgi:arabinose-5-phosphate isomerase